MNPEKALRKIEAIDMQADIFIVSQSLAENQLRRTGVNFFAGDWELGSTGKNLEKYLNRIGRTVYPPIDIRLDNGVSIRKREESFISVYNTEITQCFPGKRKVGKGDRQPNAEEINNCLKKGFLWQEIKILKPKIVMLMGRMSRNIFFRNFVPDNAFPSLLSEHLAQIVKKGEMPECLLCDHRFRILPIQHASGANPYFQKMSLDPKLTQMIIEALQ
jgi:uracil-DNA glycosylase family 4